ncbi:MAG: YbaN family protein [Bdellovibrionaceae bacterium]|nr:YbaN family protein [Bdellovibrionales bacterium]MCB9255192.1 YbaN family protein [Pseudobdellovibrionaceae bacterium]
MRYVYVIAGTVFLVIGLIGIFVPLLPTTPFLLLTAFFYSKGSRRLHRWLLQHRQLGPILVQWNEHGVVGLRAKIVATLFLGLSLGYALIFKSFFWPLKALAASCGIVVAAFLWTRPSRIRPDNSQVTNLTR